LLYEQNPFIYFTLRRQHHIVRQPI
jgi:hypothetical protein